MSARGDGRSLRALPKAHLHLHFTGSMRHATLVELAERYGISLPDALVEDWPPQLSGTDERGWWPVIAFTDDVRPVVLEFNLN